MVRRRAIAVHRPGKEEMLSMTVRVFFNNSHLPSVAIKGIAHWQAGLPAGPLSGQEDALVKTC
jgi:hypothetical protein